MSSVRSELSGHTLTISLPKNFNMTSYHDFNQAYKDHTNVQNYVMDFSLTNHLDSAALGLLLLLRQRVGDGNKIKLINLSDSVQGILKLAQFQQLFDIPELSRQV